MRAVWRLFVAYSAEESDYYPLCLKYQITHVRDKNNSKTYFLYICSCLFAQSESHGDDKDNTIQVA